MQALVHVLQLEQLRPDVCIGGMSVKGLQVARFAREQGCFGIKARLPLGQVALLFHGWSVLVRVWAPAPGAGANQHGCLGSCVPATVRVVHAIRGWER